MLDTENDGHDQDPEVHENGVEVETEGGGPRVEIVADHGAETAGDPAPDPEIAGDPAVQGKGETTGVAADQRAETEEGVFLRCSFF